MQVRSNLAPGSGSQALQLVRAELAAATAAKKCHGCGCLHETVAALEATDAGRAELAPALAEARRVFVEKRYDCLGCEVCHPAIAANAFNEAHPGAGELAIVCPTDGPRARAGWPPLPGDYHVVRYQAPVAVCTLNDAELAGALSRGAPDGLAIVGTLHTENLGIERVIENTLANPFIRFLVLCGVDTRQAVGHLPGQSLESLFANGVDEAGRIRGAKGKRPVLANVSQAEIRAFVEQVELVAMIGTRELGVIAERVLDCAGRAPGAYAGAPAPRAVASVNAVEPARLVPDPAGYLVVYPDAQKRRLLVEHFTSQGVLDCVLEGKTPAALYSAIIERGLVSRLDHAAYLGRELARAERALETGEPYVQDRAAGELPDEIPEAATSSCGCGHGCGTREK